MNLALFARQYAFPSLLACLLGAPAPAQAQEAEQTVPGEVLVGVRPSHEAAFQSQAADMTVGQVTGYQPQLHAYRLKLMPGVTLAAALAQLRKRGDVVYAEPNHILHAASAPNEGYYASYQWNLPKIQADLAWSLWQPQASVTIAVIDTGIDSTHPDLKNKMARDSAGNVIGYNALTGQAGAAMDDNWHGTHCAGIAAAQIDHGGGIAGIAGWNGVAGASDTSFTRLMPIKALNSTGAGTDATVSDSIVWAADHGAKVISMSLAGSGSSAMINAATYAWNKGCVLVAAAGNNSNSTVTYPAGCANVISVAATDSTDTLSAESNYGRWVSVAAPGVNILSTTPTYSTGSGFPLNYALGTGTSMATPHVAGEAALLWAQNPGLTNVQIVALIKSNVDSYNPYQGRVIGSGAGRINVYRALAAAGGAAAPPPVVPSPPPIVPTPPPTGSTATFVRADTTTSGTWKGVYGNQGDVIAGDTLNLPSSVQLATSGASAWTWASSTADTRALQKGVLSDRIAACWYGSGFTEDVNLTDGKSHQVAVYLVDWDSGGRVERVDVIDTTTNAVLDTRSVSGFAQGEYLVWNVQGHVRIQLTATTGNNAVLEGVFIDPVGVVSAVPPPPVVTPPPPVVSPPAGNSAAFVKVDSTTQGSWKGSYGKSGYSVIADQSTLPSYVKIAAAGNNIWTWAGSSLDVRALQKGTTSDRIAASWYSGNYTVDWNQTDNQSHQVALYCLDWDNHGRVEKIDVIDPTTNIVLNSQTVSAFAGGQYIVWKVTGHVVFRLTVLSGDNATLSGLFLD